jgi:hypothetical protein
MSTIKWRSSMGEKHHLAKLTEDAVRFIRENPRGWPYHKLATAMGVHVNTVKRVAWGLTWRHVK